MDLTKIKEQQRALQTHLATQRALNDLLETFRDNLPALRGLVASELASLNLDVVIEEGDADSIVVTVPTSSHAVRIRALKGLTFKPDQLRSEFETYPDGYHLGTVTPQSPLSLPVVVKDGNVIGTRVSSIWWTGPIDNERVSRAAKQVLMGRAAPRDIRASNCFVATAVFGTESEEIVILRDWRDDTLSKSIGGRAAVSLYYRVGPFCAACVQQDTTLRRFVRRLLVSFCNRLRRRERSNER